MSYSHPVLAALFSAIAPPAHAEAQRAAVVDAREAFHVQMEVVFARLDALNNIGAPSEDIPALRSRVADAALAYAERVVMLCPAGRGASAAVDSVIAARLWADKAIMAPSGPVRGRLISLARTESERAELAAIHAISTHEAVQAAVAQEWAAVERAVHGVPHTDQE